MKVIIITTINLLFTGFRLWKILKRSLDSKYNNISKFYNLLSEFKIHKVISTKTRECKKGL